MFKVKRYGEEIFTDKTKIFFCCHEADISFLDEISDDSMLALQKLILANL